MHYQSLAALIFWLSGGVLFYTFAGYPLFIAALARWRARPLSSPRELAPQPRVCVVLVAHNEQQVIAERLENLLASAYPPEKIRVLLVSDGSIDSTIAKAEALGDPRIEIVARTERGGKAAGLNLAISRRDEEIIVLTDARQRFTPDAIAHLVAHFSDPAIGAVSGALEISAATSATGSGVDSYWRYERFLRAAESRIDSCIGCTGAIYALRRALFTPVPDDTVLDDVVIPMQIAIKGARIIHDPAARAFDPQPLEPTTEQQRKQRTIAGNFQMLFRYPAWLLPWRNRLWWQLLSHKYLRLAAPIFLVTAFVANIVLNTRFFYQTTLAVQVLFYTVGTLGFLPGCRRLPIAALPAGFVFLNAMTFRGLHQFLTRRHRTGWNPTLPSP